MLALCTAHWCRNSGEVPHGAARVLHCTFLAALLAVMTLLMPLTSAAAPMPEPPYYSYVLYLRAEPQRDLVAEAEAIARPLLRRHRLVTAPISKDWDRAGPAPISFERRSGPQRHYDEMETQQGVRLSDLFHVPLVDRLFKGRTKPPITELVIRIGAPTRLDIPAYVEGLEIAAALAKKLEAPVILDEETGLHEHIEEWVRLAYEGQQGNHPQPAISEQNPPVLRFIGPTSLEPPEGHLLGRWLTRGLRKLGLPDLVVTDYLPRFQASTPIEMVANLLVSGHSPDEQTGDLVIQADHPGVKAVMYAALKPGGKSTVRLVPAKPLAGQPKRRVLEITFDTKPYPTLYERQMRVHLDLVAAPNLVDGPYPILSDEDMRSLWLAIARAKSKLKGLRSQWKDLLAAGTRVFVMLSEDIPYAPGARAATAKIHKTNAADWTPVWHSDRVPHEYDDLHTWIGEVGDVLVIDKDGKAEGGEVTELLKRLLPAVTKRPTP